MTLRLSNYSIKLHFVHAVQYNWCGRLLSSQFTIFSRPWAVSHSFRQFHSWTRTPFKNINRDYFAFIVSRIHKIWKESKASSLIWKQFECQSSIMRILSSAGHHLIVLIEGQEPPALRTFYLNTWIPTPKAETLCVSAGDNRVSNCQRSMQNVKTEAEVYERWTISPLIQRSQGANFLPKRNCLQTMVTSVCCMANIWCWFLHIIKWGVNTLTRNLLAAGTITKGNLNHFQGASLRNVGQGLTSPCRLNHPERSLTVWVRNEVILTSFHTNTLEYDPQKAKDNPVFKTLFSKWEQHHFLPQLPFFAWGVYVIPFLAFLSDKLVAQRAFQILTLA